ncbi:MAG: hypothetical protein ABID63_07160 [Pseudomonadota bacterium]
MHVFSRPRLVSVLPGILALLVMSGQAKAASPVYVLEELMVGAAEQQLCTKDGQWCVGMISGGEGDVGLIVTNGGETVGEMALSANEGDLWYDESFEIWPGIIRPESGEGITEGPVLIGIERGERASYSGGGASAAMLEMIRISPMEAEAAKTVLSVPASTYKMIRACFNEQDVDHRRGACHDEYVLEGKITPDRQTVNGLPMLRYDAEASSFPRGVSLHTDSTTMPPLKESDLAYETDPACTYSRLFHFDREAGIYQPDAPLPDCSDYTIP